MNYVRVKRYEVVHIYSYTYKGSLHGGEEGFGVERGWLDADLGGVSFSSEASTYLL
jgi:hypothetical protein